MCHDNPSNREQCRRLLYTGQPAPSFVRDTTYLTIPTCLEEENSERLAEQLINCIRGARILLLGEIG